MDAAAFLIAHPQIPHGDIRLLFTPDEEIGRGVNRVDLQKLGAAFGYTVDGERLGSLEDETFSADAAVVRVNGVSVHPGFAKGKMENAIKIVSDIVARLPKAQLSPESTSGREGFLHPTSIQGGLEQAELQLIVRDFTDEGLLAHEALLKKIVEEVLEGYPNSRAEIAVTEQYRNMKKVLDTCPQVVDYAAEAMRTPGKYPRGYRWFAFVLYGPSLSEYLCRRACISLPAGMGFRPRYGESSPDPGTSGNGMGRIAYLALMPTPNKIVHLKQRICSSKKKSCGCLRRFPLRWP
jgi:hypothetical protein